MPKENCFKKNSSAFDMVKVSGPPAEVLTPDLIISMTVIVRKIAIGSLVADSISRGP